MRSDVLSLMLALAVGTSAPAFAGEPSAEAEKVSPDAHVADLEKMCAENAEARAGRHAKESLYERLGKEEKIHALTREVVRLHRVNDSIKHLLDGVNDEELARRVALFLVAGTGGPPVYEGPSLTESHAHMHLTNADFLSAGGDVIQGMKNLGYGQEEIDEVVCAFVGLRDQVVLGEDRTGGHAGHVH